MDRIWIDIQSAKINPRTPLIEDKNAKHSSFKSLSLSIKRSGKELGDEVTESISFEKLPSETAEEDYRLKSFFKLLGEIPSRGNCVEIILVHYIKHLQVRS